MSVNDRPVAARARLERRQPSNQNENNSACSRLNCSRIARPFRLPRSALSPPADDAVQHVPGNGGAGARIPIRQRQPVHLAVAAADGYSHRSAGSRTRVDVQPATGTLDGRSAACPLPVLRPTRTRPCADWPCRYWRRRTSARAVSPGPRSRCQADPRARSVRGRCRACPSRSCPPVRCRRRLAAAGGAASRRRCGSRPAGSRPGGRPYRPCAGRNRRGRPPLLAGKGNRPACPEVLTTGAHEPVGQHAAFQVGAHLFLDMERQAVLGGSGVLEKGFQMPGEDLVEELLFRFATAVLGRADRCAGQHGAVPAARDGPPVLASVPA